MKSGLSHLMAPILVGIIALVLLFYVADAIKHQGSDMPLLATSSAVSASAAASAERNTLSTSTRVTLGPAPSSTKPVPQKVPEKVANKQTVLPPTSSSSAPSTQVTRVDSPYTENPLTFEAIDTLARRAVVNILCTPRGGSLRPTTGSGVMIDPRGVILTNAHVAQYVLLAQSGKFDLTCTVRSGSPATPNWIPEVLYIPTAWIIAHAADINKERATGTGEYDYALLRISSDLRGMPLTEPLPYLPIDSRETIAFLDDPLLVAGYPAEFVGGLLAQRDLYAATSIARVVKLMTFGTGAVDIFSVGGIIAAQGGSSGGPAINQWGYVVGIVTTTSDGKTTAERDLHVTTAAYINRDIKIQSGRSLKDFLASNTENISLEFKKTFEESFLALYLKALSK
jgi:S1-C subfamily serine protease